MPGGPNHLFTPLTIRGLTLRNRIFSTGHMAVMLEDGKVTDAMVEYHAAKAQGGAALTIIEAARVHPSGDSGRPAIRAYDPACVPGYAKLAKACQGHGCKVFAQLSHPGREMTMAADGTHAVAYAPSAVPNERFHVMPREMSVRMIHEVVQGFETSAANIRAAGLDGVEIVASHGYLLGQFLNPRVNQRQDAYGGSPVNRMRIIQEVIAAIRRGVGDGLVIGIRLSGEEKDHDGVEVDEMLEMAQAIGADCDLDYLNVTAGTSAGLAGSTHIVPSMRFEAGYTTPLSAAIRAKVHKPVFVAGRINQPQIAEQTLASGAADMCGMTRALISDPEMPRKAEAGALDDIRACVACNQACIGHMLNACSISCIQHPETGRELTYGTPEPVAAPRKVMVIGGGPAGLKAAAVAATRGHQVTLYEAQAQLGGQVNLAQLLPGRAEFGGVTTNLAREVRNAGVDVRLNTLVTRDFIQAQAPDAIVIAVGGTCRMPRIEGAEDAHVVSAWQVLEGQANVGARVVIADWRCDWVGMGLAERFARDGCHVRLAVNGMVAGQTIQQYARDTWLCDLHKLGVEIIPHLRLYGADADDAYFQHTLSGEAVILNEVDTLVSALGTQSETTLEAELKDYEGALHVIGDALCPRTVEEAVLEGLKVASSL
ncbi:oxidoreductase [Ruegeria atlantica]|uniref:NADH oxidase n=1 Tax=Ruegeria atlantica TaxID=81569 RepID=A0A0N7LQR5_9RHOB|nr:FAD-dependent oxidoreductase [Ruegeria atlantica]CUH48756.1 NADH oxidase [Ruegeria atlantica]